MQTPRTRIKQANAFGLLDVHGNVWEWCQDTGHRNYEGAPTDGSAWEEAGEIGHVFRGGSYNSADRYCRPASRVRKMFGFGKGFAYGLLGFRPAR